MLILEQIAKQDQITLTDEDLDEGYKGLAEIMGQDVETIKRYYEARDRVDALKEELLKEKTLKYLADHANISEVERDALDQKPAGQAEEG